MSSNNVLSFTICVRKKTHVDDECKYRYVILKTVRKFHTSVVSFWVFLRCTSLTSCFASGLHWGTRLRPNSCRPTLDDLPPTAAGVDSKSA